MDHGIYLQLGHSVLAVLVRVQMIEVLHGLSSFACRLLLLLLSLLLLLLNLSIVVVWSRLMSFFGDSYTSMC